MYIYIQVFDSCSENEHSLDTLKGYNENYNHKKGHYYYTYYNIGYMY